MKIVSRLIVPVALAACLLSGTARAQSRIATVDFQKVVTNYYKTKQAEVAIEDRANELRKEYNAMLDELNKAKNEYKKLVDAAADQVVSAEERDKRKKAADAKQDDIARQTQEAEMYGRQAEATIRDLRHRMRDRIFDDIRPVLNAKAKSSGYALVIDTSAKSANNTLELISLALTRVNPAEEAAKTPNVVLYASSDSDITDALLKQLNAGAPLETPAPAEKKDGKK
jgi:Skp family chaperone for outer membrane proteins